MTEEEKKEVLRKYKIDTGICYICGKSDSIDHLEYVEKSGRLIWFHKECTKNW